MPALPAGAVIRVMPRSQGDYVVGMVVACLSAGNELFAHRVVQRAKWRGMPYIITCGDHWTVCDSPTPAVNIVGEVTSFQVDGVWRAVPAQDARPWPQSLVTRSSLALVSVVGRLNPFAARHVAGLMLNAGARIKALATWRAPT